MKLFKVVTLAPKDSPEPKEVTAFYVAKDMNAVIKAHELDLTDENTDVLQIVELAAYVTVL